MSKDNRKDAAKGRDEGKFVELEGAEHGKVVVRFPPEASGYLHIGHAKAALLNQYYQQNFAGRLVMRFDDTNPAKEDAHFEQVIKEDLQLLDIKPDIWSHSSDYFEFMLESCEKLLREGKAFVDDTETEEMRRQREARQNAARRDASAESNLELWEEMKKGTERGQQCCVRIKIDMSSNNGALRDPTIYRCKLEPHVRTGDKYKVYPTYDFACPIVDSMDGVTHALRTTEYTDRDQQYAIIADALGIRKSRIWAYSRLNMTHTVMSKRKLTWLVDEKFVDGWDDPRMPTVRGVIRRGLTVEGLKQFILAQGGSRAVVVMDWDKIWAFNKKVIDPIAPRYTALDKSAKPLVEVHLDPAFEPVQETAALHPKNSDVGTKSLWRSNTLLVEAEDAALMKDNDVVTFVNWGNIRITGRRDDGSLTAKLELENTDYKKTLKVTWLAKQDLINVEAIEYSHIISKAIVGKDEDWKDFVNKDSKKTLSFVGEPALRNVKKGDIIQIQRKGFYKCDRAFESDDNPLILIAIPDGSISKDAPAAPPAEKTKPASKAGPTKAEAAQPKIPLDSAEAIESAKKIDEQAELVRQFKALDPKSDSTKEAIARLLEFKQGYKSLVGVDYKPPAVAK